MERRESSHKMMRGREWAQVENEMKKEERTRRDKKRGVYSNEEWDRGLISSYR